MHWVCVCSYCKKHCSFSHVYPCGQWLYHVFNTCIWVSNLSPLPGTILVLKLRVPHPWNPSVLGKPGQLVTLLPCFLCNFRPLHAFSQTLTTYEVGAIMVPIEQMRKTMFLGNKNVSKLTQLAPVSHDSNPQIRSPPITAPKRCTGWAPGVLRLVAPKATSCIKDPESGFSWSTWLDSLPTSPPSESAEPWKDRGQSLAILRGNSKLCSTVETLYYQAFTPSIHT